MVEVLPCIVEQRRVLAERALDDVVERPDLEFGALQQVVAVGDIGLMMLVAVIFQRLLRYLRRERVVGIRQFGKREGHEAPSLVKGYRYVKS
jgi:hypothetical protein